MNSKPVNYKEAVEYIESIPKFTQKHTQEHTREFLERLGRPGAWGCKTGLCRRVYKNFKGDF